MSDVDNRTDQELPRMQLADDRPRCQIRWIGRDGQPTPDTNIAIGRVRTTHADTNDRLRFKGDPAWARPVQPSEWFNICAEHAKQLDQPNMINAGWEWQCSNCEIPIAHVRAKLSLARRDDAKPLCKDCVTAEQTATHYAGRDLLPMDQAFAITETLFKWIYERTAEQTAERRLALSTIAAIVCDATSACILNQPLHDAYARSKRLRSIP